MNKIRGVTDPPTPVFDTTDWSFHPSESRVDTPVQQEVSAYFEDKLVDVTLEDIHPSVSAYVLSDVNVRMLTEVYAPEVCRIAKRNAKTFWLYPKGTRALIFIVDSNPRTGYTRAIGTFRSIMFDRKTLSSGVARTYGAVRSPVVNRKRIFNPIRRR